jgi:hypothetical protein
MATALSGLFDSGALMRNWRRRAGSLFAVVAHRTTDTAAASKVPADDRLAWLDGQDEIRLADREADLAAALLQGLIKY